MKKLFSALCLLVIFSLALGACGAPRDPNALQVWIQWGDNPKQIQDLFDTYTTETGIKVQVTAPVDSDKILPASPARIRPIY